VRFEVLTTMSMNMVLFWDSGRYRPTFQRIVLPPLTLRIRFTGLGSVRYSQLAIRELPPQWKYFVIVAL
jgi:hypothetical protein